MIYFDNSATSYPKPLCVKFTAAKSLAQYSFNSGRGGYTESLKAAEKIFNVREKVGALFSCKPENVAFTKNCTEALNYAIKGSAVKGSHILISSLEHNSVSRVVNKICEKGYCEYSVFPCCDNTEKCFNNFKIAIRKNTKLVICTFASNAFGTMLPIKEIGLFCRERGIRFIVDAAQGAGIYPIDMQKCCIDILCASGHKSLMAPMGTGFIALSDGIKLNTVFEGGTGTNSLSFNQPSFMPERLESGTLNNPGIIALGRAIDYITDKGIEVLYKAEIELINYLYSSLKEVKDIKLYTEPCEGKSMPVLSFNYKDYSSEKTSALLAQKGICTRAGYHCSPLAHKTFNTLNTGTVRISLGHFNNKKECDRFINVVKKL